MEIIDGILETREIKRLKEENELLKEEIKELRNAIKNCYDTMFSLEIISDYEERQHEKEEIEEL